MCTSTGPDGVRKISVVNTTPVLNSTLGWRVSAISLPTNGLPGTIVPARVDRENSRSSANFAAEKYVLRGRCTMRAIRETKERVVKRWLEYTIRHSFFQ